MAASERPERHEERNETSITDVEQREADGGLLTRNNEYGGLEPRIRNRPEQQPLNEDVADAMDYDEHGNPREILRGTTPTY
jgi:hypothetical protein